MKPEEYKKYLFYDLPDCELVRKARQENIELLTSLRRLELQGQCDSSDCESYCWRPLVVLSVLMVLVAIAVNLLTH